MTIIKNSQNKDILSVKVSIFTQKTANSSLSKTIFIRISPSVENSIKYTGPDGRTSDDINDLVFRPRRDTAKDVAGDWQYFRDGLTVKISKSLNLILFPPPGVSIEDNINQAEKIRNICAIIPVLGLFIKYIWFYSTVKEKGSRDYKQMGRKPEYDGYRNFHYGVICREAEWVRHYKKRFNPEWGKWYNWLFLSPHGDDPRDRIQINTGIDCYDNRKKHRRK
jgi:hypothetical protein